MSEEIGNLIALHEAAIRGHRKLSFVPLHTAAAVGDYGGARAVLEAIESPSKRKELLLACSRQGSTALHLAAQHGHTQIVGMLLSLAPRSTAADMLLKPDLSCQALPIHYAIRGRHHATIKLLLKTLTDSSHSALAQCFQHRDTGGNTPLHAAAATGDVDTVNLLLDAATKQDLRRNMLLGFSTPKQPATTPLHIAAHEAYGAVIDALLIKAASSEMVTEMILKEDSHGCTPLHEAAASRNPAVLYQLYQRLQLSAAGAKLPTLLQRANLDGYTPLHSAAACGHLEVVSQMLKSAAATGPRTLKCVLLACHSSGTPLHAAAARGHTAVVSALLAACPKHLAAKLIQTQDAHGRTPLAHAAAAGQTAVMKQLLQKLTECEPKRVPAHLIQPDARGWTPLHAAAAHGRHKAMAALLQHAAECHLPQLTMATKRTPDRITPLMLAASSGSTLGVQCLLDSLLALGKEVLAKELTRSDVDGDTAWHYVMYPKMFLCQGMEEDVAVSIAEQLVEAAERADVPVADVVQHRDTTLL